ncbi:MAG: hypothetical protein KGO93_08065 [Cyanobacteria bacterium REEB446]|nr:hypothetical protein [Cyanobacteria bacterium REEB446]
MRKAPRSFRENKPKNLAVSFYDTVILLLSTAFCTPLGQAILLYLIDEKNEIVLVKFLMSIALAFLGIILLLYWTLFNRKDLC